MRAFCSEHVLLGEAVKTYEPVEQKPDSAAFELPYGDYKYNITFDSSDLDFLLGRGFAKILGEEAVRGMLYDAEVDLSPDLPLFVGSGQIRTEPSANTSLHSAQMQIITSTLSDTNKHRGILSVEKSILGEWSLLGYEQQPPLPKLHQNRTLVVIQ